MKAMTEKDFETLLRKFADDPDDVIVERDTIVFRANGENFSLTLRRDEDGVLYCCETAPEKREMKVRSWIARRLANFPELAEKILSAVDDDAKFISVPSRFESLDGRDGGEDVEKTTESLFSELSRTDTWSTHVYYLLSEAGDGKTWIMNRLARHAAQSYLDGKSSFLFLPVGLDGRPFMRFDEVVIGVLAQKYRFRRFYYEAVIELAKWGFLVLGLDGFEEMTVEGRENKVISSLGNLLQQHDSNGALVISARRAFYEYALNIQGPLMGAIRDIQVDFHAFRLRGWSKKEFMSLMQAFGFSELDARRIYERLEQRLGAEHPLLTRPVLTRKLVEMLEDAEIESDGNSDQLIEAFSPEHDEQKVLKSFVDLLLSREASQKWIHYSGTTTNAHQQLLTSAEHQELMEEIAEETWLSRTELLQEDVLKSIVQLFCENKGKSPSDSQECMEKIVHHAMIVKSGMAYAFCHEAFRQFFLGSRIARVLCSGHSSSLLNQVFSLDVFPDGIADIIAYWAVAFEVPFATIQSAIDTIRMGSPRNTPINQNSASILSALWKRLSPPGVQFNNLYFSSSATSDVPFSSVSFSNCNFENLKIPANSMVGDITLKNCSVLAMSLPRNAHFGRPSSLDEISRPSKVVVGSEGDGPFELYDPQSILNTMEKCGFIIPVESSGQLEQCSVSQEDAALFSAFDKLMRLFQRTTGVSGRLLKTKHNSDWSEWENSYLPTFVKQGLIRQAEWHGSGQDVRYVLTVSPEKIESAKRQSVGHFQEFCRILRAG